jgi:hypothetical protein
VFHKEPLSLKDQAIVDKLQKACPDEDRASSDGNSCANVIVKTVNLTTSPDEAMQKLWEAQSTSELPWMVVKYPGSSRIPENVWSGHFTATAVEALLDSPTRKEIARRILEGEAAVWVLLESGIQQQDDAAARLLETQLKKMENTLANFSFKKKSSIIRNTEEFIYSYEISAPDGDGIADMAYTQVNSDPRVKFSMVRLSRNDPGEQIFVQMLLHTEWDIKTILKPMAFPIFGRGRVLYVLVGDGINEDNIERACSFLVGWCSCEVKELNPGVDILMSVNWGDMIAEQLVEYYEETPLIMGSSKSATTRDGNSGTLKRNILIVALAQILTVAIVTCVVLWKKRQGNRHVSNFSKIS